MSRTFILLLLAAPLSVHVPARAQVLPDGSSVRVEFPSAELATDRGRAALRERLARAARPLCRDLGSSSAVDYREAVQDCVDSAVEDAMRRLDGRGPVSGPRTGKDSPSSG